MENKNTFLSHAGSDHLAALEIADKVYNYLGSTPHFSIEVFNTSEQRFRFKEIKEIILAGSDFKEEYEKWKTELTIYLKKNLLDADAYLLLVTERDLLENSEWILFEMELAKELAIKRGAAFFFPCLYKNASYSEVPEIAIEFNAVNLNTEKGFSDFGNQLREYFNITSL